MDMIEYYAVKIDDQSDIDKRNGLFMHELLGYNGYEEDYIPEVSIEESIRKSISTFKSYQDIKLFNRLDKSVENKSIQFMAIGDASFVFGTTMQPGESGTMIPVIICPEVFDKTSYAFLGHEFHHALKDLNIKERIVKDRLVDVIPMFYERVCAFEEQEEKVSKEILKRRLILLEDIRELDNDDCTDQLKEFNSYYYALALYTRYKKDKILVLRLISRVLNGEISTLDLLNMLDIYNSDLDYVVSRELETIKQYVLD